MARGQLASVVPSPGERIFADLLLREFEITDVLTVSEYSSRLGHALREVGPAILEGEVQSPKMSPRGMLFFQLSDGEATVSCKVFPREVARLEHRPGSGDLVRVCVDRPDFYPAQGSLSLIVSQLTRAGEGELLRRRAELIARLKREGLCDPSRRRPLPAFPATVGVIAAEGSDGLSDVVKALTDRWPPIRVITCASLVQGKAAPRALINALAAFQEQVDVEVIVLARGGGSVQDLACFDDEALCRALFACEIPVVCAIGHTDNNPVCNHVTWSAYTPSRSAEMVVPSVTQVRQEIVRAKEVVHSAAGQLRLALERVRAAALRLDAEAALDARGAEVHRAATAVTGTLSGFFHEHKSELADVRAALAVTPRRAVLELANRRAAVSSAGGALARTGEHFLTQRQLVVHEAQLLRAGIDARVRDQARSVQHLAQLIAAQDFRRRGWLLASRAGVPVRSAVDLQAADRLDLQLHDGDAQVIVESVQSQPRRSEEP